MQRKERLRLGHKLLLILPLAVFPFFLIYFYFPYNDALSRWAQLPLNIFHIGYRASGRLDQWEADYRRCLVHTLPVDFSWGHSEQWIEECQANRIRGIFGVLDLNSENDDKLIILPRPSPTYTRVFTPPPYQTLPLEPSCVLVTLGVNPNLEGELSVKQLLPQCEFYGVDPDPRMGTIYEPLGVYYQLNVAGPSGQSAVSTVPILQLFTARLLLSRADFVFVDKEGGEYDILQQLMDNGELIRNGITICQINIKLYGPLSNYAMDSEKYKRLMFNMTNHSPFLPLWAHGNDHYEKQFYVNAKDPFCVEKYLKDAFTNSTVT